MRRSRVRYLNGPFLGTEAVAAGVLTRAQLRGPMVRRLFRGVYLPASEPVNPTVRARAATLLLPDGAIVTGRSAAAVRGVRLGWADDPIEVAVPEAERFGPVRGIRVVRTRVASDDGVPWAHGRLATPVRSAFDALRWRGLSEVVGDLDAMVRDGQLTLHQLRGYLNERHDHGIVNARAALALADPRAESPPESALRVYLMLGGLDPVPQFEIRLPDGRHIRVDLAFPDRRVAVEYDGQWHGAREQLARDHWRANVLNEQRWTTVHVNAAMMRDPSAVVHQVRGVLAAAA